MAPLSYLPSFESLTLGDIVHTFSPARRIPIVKLTIIGDYIYHAKTT